MHDNVFETSIRSQEILETLWRLVEEEKQPAVSCSLLNCSEKDEDLEDLKTVRDAVDYVHERTSQS